MGILRRFDMQTNLNLRSQIIGIPARRTQRQRQARRHAQSKIDEEKKAADDSAGQQADSAVRESTPDPLPKASRAEIPKIPPSRRESSSSQKVGLLQVVFLPRLLWNKRTTCERWTSELHGLHNH